MPNRYAPVVAMSADGRLEVFIAWLDGNIYHRWQTEVTDKGGTWYMKWISHGKRGTGFTGPLSLISNEDGRLELFAKTHENEIYHKWQWKQNVNWTDWVFLAKGVHFQVAKNVNSELEIFIVTSQGGLAHNRQQSRNGPWGNTFGIPPRANWPRVEYFGRPAVALNSAGKLELFVSGYPEGSSFKNHRIYHVTATEVEKFAFNDSSGIRASNPVLGQSADKRLELFALGFPDTGIFHAWETTFGNWSSWYSHGSPANSLLGIAPLASHDDERLALRIVAADKIHGKTQLYQSGPWTNWFVDSPRELLSDPALVLNSQRRLNMFVSADEVHPVYHRYELTPNGKWSVAAEDWNWDSLGYPGNP